MSQKSSVEAHPISSQTPMQPALLAALASLEVQLDDELARYRRAKAGIHNHPKPHLGRSSTPKPLELIDISTDNQTPPPQAPESPIPATNLVPPPPPPPPGYISAPTVGTQTLAQNTQIQPPPPPAPTITNVDSTKPPEVEPDGSIVPTATESATGDTLVDTSTTRTEPDDYLESSEELLRSLAEEQPKPEQKVKFTDSLLTPLNIGSMLLLLLASAMLGYVLMNPKSLPKFNFANNTAANFNASNNAVTPNTATTNNNTTTPSAQVAPIPKSPDLASREFVDLNLDNVSTLKPQPKPQPATPKPSTATATTAPGQPQPTTATAGGVSVQVRPLAPLPPPQLPTATTSQPAVTQQLPPVSAASQPATTPTPSNQKLVPSQDGWFHLVMDNKTPNALEEARKAVPDAYLSPKGSIIYLGSRKSGAEAEKLLQQLQAQGLKARIAQP